jgi:diguanylate cyclase (GGDEF)-like protein/PAS domain S-box-containing protein
MRIDGEPSASAVTVLLIGESALDADRMKGALDDAGGRFDVHWVETLEDARTAMVEARYDCLVVELELSASEGLDVIDALRAHAVDSAIVVLSTRKGSEFGSRSTERGAEEYLLKAEISTPQVQRSVDLAVQRKRSENLARHIAARSTTVLAALVEGVIVLDARAHVASLNPAAEVLLGVTSSELVGRHIAAAPWSILNRDGTEMSDSERPSYLTIKSGQPLSGVISGFRRGDGELIWIEVNTSPLLGADGRVDGVVVSMQNVTARLAAEEGIHFQTVLLAAIGQAVVVTDPEGRVVFWNPAAERMHGWLAADALGEYASALVPPASVEQAQEIADTIAAGNTWTGDFIALRQDGTQFPAIVTDTPVFDDDGQLVAIIAISTDISERKEVEKAAQALAAIVETTGDAIFTTSVAGIILTWNRGAEQLYGYNAGDAIGCHVSLLNPHEVGNEVESILAAVLAGETVRGLETVRHRRDGTGIDVSLTVSPIFGDDGTVLAASVIAHDISDRCRLEGELVRQAMEDTLTGLPNRTLLADRLAQAVASSTRRGTPLAVLFVDVDHFKNVNDENGHLVGDQLLIHIARRLQDLMRPADTVARFGGDEFVIVCEDTDQALAQQIASSVAAALVEPIEIGGQQFHVTASVGIAVAPPLGADGDLLLRNADAAMYDAKAHGRAKWRVFDRAMSEQSSQRLELTNELRKALNDGGLSVHYQPLIEIATGRVVGIEALARWAHPTRGWVPPAVFVPLSEDGGFVSILDHWVLEQACQDASNLRSRALLPPDAGVMVNISARGIADPDLVDIVTQAAARARLPLDLLELEVTERGLMSEAPMAYDVLATLRSLGVGIALDDFGTGHSSLTNIRELPVTTIKIDRSFIKNIAKRPDDLAIAASVVDLARAIGLRSVAEGVENSAQLALLVRLGCIAGQGFLWSGALPAGKLGSLLSHAPSGFLAVAVNDNEPTIERPAVGVTNEHGLHRLIELHRIGGSPTTIAAALNADGYRTPRGLRWHTSTIARVIQDLAYRATNPDPKVPL